MNKTVFLEQAELYFEKQENLGNEQNCILHNPRGVLPYQAVGGGRGLDRTSSLEAKFGVRPGQVHQIRGKIWEVLLPQDAKVEENPNFGVISEIQRAKFGVFVTYIFGGKIWGSKKNFRGKFWGQAPRSPDMKVPPPPPGCTTSKILTFEIRKTIFCDTSCILHNNQNCNLKARKTVICETSKTEFGKMR